MTFAEPVLTSDPRQAVNGRALAWRELVEGVHATRHGSPERDTVVSVFMQRMGSHFARMASKIVHGVNVDVKHHRDDALDFIHLELVGMIDDMDRGALDEVHNHDAVLNVRATRAFRKWLTSAKGPYPHQGSRDDTLNRQRAADWRNRLRDELGREPTDGEIIAAQNADVLARNPNAKPQSLVQQRHLGPRQGVMVGFDDADAMDRALVQSGVFADSVDPAGVAFTVFDRKMLAQRVMERVRQHSDPVVVAVGLFVWSTQTGDVACDLPTVQDVVQGLGLSRSRALQAWTLVVQAIPRVLLAEDGVVPWGSAA